MGREAKQAAFSALREVYDGRWTRLVGTDYGKRIAWEGHVGFLAGVTTEIDSEFELNNKLGERFLYFRLLPLTDQELESQAALALRPNRDLYVLRLLTAEFFECVASPQASTTCEPAEERFLIKLSNIVVRCRSSVDRDPQSREIERIHAPEAPARLIQQLRLLLVGLKAIGVISPYCYKLVRKVALDSMPPNRLNVLRALAARNRPATFQELSEILSMSNTMLRRALQELKAHRVVESTPSTQDKGELWRLLPHWAAAWSEAHLNPGTSADARPFARIPDLSVGVRAFPKGRV